MRVLILDLDTLRADHLGCYGYHRDTSPNLDRIAAGGVRLTQNYCSDAPCLPSRAAWVTGRFGIHNGAVGHGGTCADLLLTGESRGFRDPLDTTSLWSIFRRAGMHTCSISPFAERHSFWPFLAGLNEMHNTGRGGMESAEHVTPTVLDWIERNGAGDNWCLHVNYWDAHTPYRAPEDFGNPFADDPLPAWLTQEVIDRHQQAVGPHCAREVAMYDNSTSPEYPRHPGEVRNMDDARRMIDGYDCGIRYMDGHIGQLLDVLAARGVLDDLAIIVTADHGENMGEMGIWGEHATADVPTCHVPMLIRWPGKAAAGATHDGLHYTLDLLPTLADLLGLEVPGRWDGRSYAAALAGEPCEGRDELILSQCAHVCQRSVRFGPWLYMRTYHDGYHLFNDEMLYDLDEDPHEQNDLAAARPEVCAQGVRRLEAWHAEMMATQLDGHTVDPMQVVLAEGGPLHARGELRKYCEYLEKTDRGWAIPELKKRHPREFA